MEINSTSLCQIAPEKRVLLLPHCLRPSASCTARYDREQGLLCESCEENCSINQLKTAAEKRGFGGVCIAPGGSLALYYIKTHLPEGIVAVACGKELEMGIRAVISLGNNGDHQNNVVLETVSLCQDGCIDTQVDLDAVLEIINL